MRKRKGHHVVSMARRFLSSVSSIFACGIARLTPEQKAMLEAMEKDYEEFIRQQPTGTKVHRSKKSETEPNPEGHQKCDQALKTMKPTATFFVATLVASSIFAADTNAGKVQDALAKLATK
jgi:hypothetical protein